GFAIRRPYRRAINTSYSQRWIDSICDHAACRRQQCDTICSLAVLSCCGFLRKQHPPPAAVHEPIARIPTYFMPERTTMPESATLDAFARPLVPRAHVH